MSLSVRLRAWLHGTATHAARHDGAWAGVIAAIAVFGAMSGVIDSAAAHARAGGAFAAKIVESLAAAPIAPPQPRPVRVRWEGRDVDGDGAADFLNPTGLQPRGFDHYGFGYFGASRDGGVRRHEGLDYRAQAGQPVRAPLSGYVTKIGLAYPGDTVLKYVEISNPALRYKARVFYVDPSVAEGQAVHMGDVVGTAHSLQDRYPEGMTDHVHLELTAPDGEKFDPNKVILARVEVIPLIG